jgi:AcrR family transcriptional regulator
MQHRDRRQDILKAAIELFARKGFRGTTTRDLATQADVNEAIIFRHFTNKEELYRAILEAKMSKQDQSKINEVMRLAGETDERQFLEAFGHMFLDKHEKDTTFIRLLLFSALEGHELHDMFLSSMPERSPLAVYIQKRIDQGRFKKMDADLAARAFVGMFFMHFQMPDSV